MQPWWLPFFLLNVAVNWVIPFAVLLPPTSKRSAAVLGTISLVVLAGRGSDLDLHVAPQVFGERPGLGLPETVPFLLAIRIGFLTFRAAFASHSPVPDRDPFLAQSLSYRSEM